MAPIDTPFIPAEVLAPLPPAWHAASIILAVLSGSLGTYWTIALYRLVRTWRAIPTARAGLRVAAAGPPPSVCVIIPAHNEGNTIAGVVRSLRAQDHGGALSVVLCLDRCTDGTADAARDAIGPDPRFTIVEVAACPEGWAGKVNAVWRGVQTPPARAADLLLFADADTSFDPACVRACAALLRHRSLDLLSLLSTLTSDAWFERLAQPAAGFELVRQYPISRANRRDNPRAFANGQFMLFRRDAYEAVGGHEAVHDELLEDIALARKIAEARLVPGLFLADGLLRCRMYDSWPAFCAGWKRIYIEAAKRKPGRLARSAMAAAIPGVILPGAAALSLLNSVLLLLLADQAADTRRTALISLGLAAWGLGTFALVIGAAYRLARAPLWTMPAYPVGAWLVARLLRDARCDLRGRVPVKWAGREYIREPR